MRPIARISALILILAVPVLAQDANVVARERALYEQWTKAYGRKDWPRAIEVGTRLVELRPDSPLHTYNLACAHARAGDPDEAVLWLQRAAENGFAFPTTFTSDKDLESVREHEGYALALKQVMANHEKAFAEFRLRADRAEPLLIDPPGYTGEQPAPLIVVLHGRGGTAGFIALAWKKAAAELGAVIVAPQSFDRLASGYHWQKIEEGEYLVMQAVRYAKLKRNIDPERVVLTGFSQGGYLSFVAAARHPEAFAGVIPVASYMDEAVSPPEKTELAPRYYIMVGAHDPDAQGARDSHALLEEAGIEAKLRVYEGLGHALPPDRTKEFVDAVRWVLGEE